MDLIRFVSLIEVIELHRRAMEMAGQAPSDLVRRDALESVIAQSKQHAWYTRATIPELAVYITTRIALAHAFVDGNKRTAAYTGLQFLGQNGARDPDEDELISFGNWLLKYVESDHEVRESVLIEFTDFVEGWFE